MHIRAFAYSIHLSLSLCLTCISEKMHVHTHTHTHTRTHTHTLNLILIYIYNLYIWNYTDMIEVYLERKGILAAKCVWTRICCCFWLIALPFRFVSESLNLTRIERIGRTMSMSAGKSQCLTGKSLTKAHFSMAMSTYRRYLIQFAIDSPVDSTSEWKIPTTCSLKVKTLFKRRIAGGHSIWRTGKPCGKSSRPPLS